MIQFNLELRVYPTTANTTLAPAKLFRAVKELTHVALDELPALVYQVKISTFKLISFHTTL